MHILHCKHCRATTRHLTQAVKPLLSLTGGKPISQSIEKWPHIFATECSWGKRKTHFTTVFVRCPTARPRTRRLLEGGTGLIRGSFQTPWTEQPEPDKRPRRVFHSSPSGMEEVQFQTAFQRASHSWPPCPPPLWAKYLRCASLAFVVRQGLPWVCEWPGDDGREGAKYSPASSRLDYIG